MPSHRLLIPLAAFLAILPLLLHGPTCGHDFDFHLLSWLEAAPQLTHGAWPHWAFTPAFNAGEPRFTFYPPISWLLGALLTLVFPIQFAGTAFTFLALTLSGFTAHRLARALAPAAHPALPTLATTLYLANPYMLFTAYERSAFAELLAAAWLPLLFQAALLPHRKPRRQVLALALPIALLWLTNAPAAVMACYALALLTLLRLVLPARDATQTAPIPTRRTLLLTTLAGTVFGLTLPAFYLVPAAYERRFVQIAMATITGMRPQDHFLFHRMLPSTPDNDFHNAVVRTASLISLLLLVAIAGMLLRLWLLKSRSASTLSLAILTLLLACLLTPPSLPLWLHTPELLFLQFPWRLNALLAVILLTLTAQALQPSPAATPYPIHRAASPRDEWVRHKILPATLPILLAIVLILPAYTLFHQPCDTEDAPQSRAALFHSPLGTEPTDEYTPLNADSDQLHPHDPPFWSTCLTPNAARPDPNLPAPPAARPGPLPAHLNLTLPCPSLLVLNRRQYPNWSLTLNLHPVVPASPERDDGLITLLVPAGPDTLDLTYTRTPDQTLGLVLSACALLALITLRQRNSDPAAS